MRKRDMGVWVSGCVGQWVCQKVYHRVYHREHRCGWVGRLEIVTWGCVSVGISEGAS